MTLLALILAKMFLFGTIGLFLTIVWGAAFNLNPEGWVLWVLRLFTVMATIPILAAGVTFIFM